MSASDTTPMTPATRAYWTTQELAERYGVDVDTIYNMATTASLPHLRLGRIYRFPIEGVLEWERQRTVMDTTGSLAVRTPRAPRPDAKRPLRGPARRGGFVPQPYAGPLRKR